MIAISSVPCTTSYSNRSNNWLNLIFTYTSQIGLHRLPSPKQTLWVSIFYIEYHKTEHEGIAEQKQKSMPLPGFPENCMLFIPTS